MSKINFPDSPTVDQEFVVGNKRYKWDGATWNLLVTSDRADSPTITSVEEGDEQVTFTITNNDEETAVITYEVSIAGDDTPDEFVLELASGATSSNLTVDGLTNDQAYIIYAKAIVVEKLPSEPVFITMSPAPPPIEFMSATGGTTLEYDSGGSRYRSHTFTSDGNFVVTELSNVDTERNKVDYLIIAGGAGGGSNRGGGGGAGGFKTTITPVPGDQSADAKIAVTATTFSVVIGAGGNGATTNGFAGQSGTNSSVAFTGTPTATGGGFGGGNPFVIASGDGGNGGSGGGASGPGEIGGTGTTGQGRNGGNGAAGATGGGGGGAGAVGVNAAENVGGNGGNGLANLLRTGSNETRAGGGGGGSQATGATAGTGGAGGGGNGAASDGPLTGDNATVNTGSGGGGGSAAGGQGGNGAAGIVVIRYEIAPSV
jgi:hypothetical protein